MAPETNNGGCLCYVEAEGRSEEREGIRQATCLGARFLFLETHCFDLTIGQCRRLLTRKKIPKPTLEAWVFSGHGKNKNTNILRRFPTLTSHYTLLNIAVRRWPIVPKLNTEF